MSNPNAEFWHVLGATTCDWRELEVGEVFLYENGPMRQIMKVTAKTEDSFDACIAFGEDLPAKHKVFIAGGKS